MSYLIIRVRPSVTLAANSPAFAETALVQCQYRSRDDSSIFMYRISWIVNLHYIAHTSRLSPYCICDISPESEA